MTIAQLEKIPHRELTQWQAYDQLDPIGGYRQDLNTAFMAYMAYGDKRKHTISDFLVIDPNPMSADMRDQVEVANQKNKLEQQIARLAAGFERVKIKGE